MLGTREIDVSENTVVILLVSIAIPWVDIRAQYLVRLPPVRWPWHHLHQHYFILLSHGREFETINVEVFLEMVEAAEMVEEAGVVDADGMGRRRFTG